jgi:hypothetical protein
MAIHPTAARPATASAAAKPLTSQPDADDLATVGWITVGSAGATKYVGASVTSEGLVGSDGATKCVVVGAFMSTPEGSCGPLGPRSPTRSLEVRERRHFFRD